MTNSTILDAGAITQHQPLSENPPPLCEARLKTLCQQYLKYRSDLEAIDQETNRIINGLGQLTAEVANLLGPMEDPMVMEVDGVLVVINVAEGLLVPKQLAASLAVAAKAEDVLGEVAA